MASNDVWSKDDGTYTGWGHHWAVAEMLECTTPGPATVLAATINLPDATHAVPVSGVAVAAAKINLVSVILGTTLGPFVVETTFVSQQEVINAAEVPNNTTVPWAQIVALQVFNATPVSPLTIVDALILENTGRVEANTVGPMVVQRAGFLPGDIINVDGSTRLSGPVNADINAINITLADFDLLYGTAGPLDARAADINLVNIILASPEATGAVTVAAAINSGDFTYTSILGPLTTVVDAKINLINIINASPAAELLVLSAQAFGLNITNAVQISALSTTVAADPVYYSPSGSLIDITAGELQWRTTRASIQEGALPDTPAIRTIHVGAEDRTIRILSENRAIHICKEDRTIRVTVEDRSIKVPGEDRTIAIKRGLR